MSLPIGKQAPDFSLPDQNGKIVHLKDFKGKKWVVLYFYPKDNTPGCTAESCSFRDAYEDFTSAGAEVIGVSSDSVDSHQNFSTKHRLPFLLLSDEGGQLRKEYKIPSTLGLFPGRVTYVIDKEGIVRHYFSSQLNATKHVQEAMKIVKAG